MVSPSNPLDLINYERTWREVICINPGHEIVKFDTNEVGNIRCPICESPMVTFVKPVIIIESNRPE